VEGLAYAHNKKVIHKDIKPQNMMLTKEGVIKLMDFGIAETVHSSMSRLKKTGSSGTLVYMSPEQLRGKDVGKEADIYSLGATLYELLTGNPPFYRGDIYSQIINEKPEPLAGVSTQINRIVLKCLEKEKEKRFRDCNALTKALQQSETAAAAEPVKNITGNHTKHPPSIPVTPRKESSKTPAPLPYKKKKFTVWKIALFFILLIITLGALYFMTTYNRKVEVTVNSSPAGAKLYIDNVYSGTTPVTVPLSYATHGFKLQKETYKVFETGQTISQATTHFNFHLVHAATYTSKVAGIAMVFVKGGTFQMGWTSEQSDCDANEKPVHTVTVSGFYIGKHEVTQKQWKAIMGNNPSYFKGDNLPPVEQVSWDDVQEFLEKLNEKTGQHYRLPTEGEWEYAARGGSVSSPTKYTGSNNIDEVAWYGNNGNKTHPVGTKKPNELSIYDMSGNVWEWCSDWYDKNYYGNSPQYNPQGPSSGSRRVGRGGSCYSRARFCRVANRDYDSPGYRSCILGFRLVLVP